ncbi:MAG: hypothetical protein ACRD8Z_16075 [Nitrososphaeraceae archaeon]
MTTDDMTDKQKTIWMLTILQAVINEQVKAKQLQKHVGSYIYQACKEEARRQGWIS